MILLLAIVFLWFVFWYLFAALYTFLAGGNAVSFWLTMFITPLAAFLLFFVYTLLEANVYDPSHSKKKISGKVFWAVAVYFFLPAILNGTSLVLKNLGYDTAGHYVFRYRYVSLLVAPLFLEICAVVFERFNGAMASSTIAESGIANAIAARGKQKNVPTTAGSSPSNSADGQIP